MYTITIYTDDNFDTTLSSEFNLFGYTGSLTGHTWVKLGGGSSDIETGLQFGSTDKDEDGIDEFTDGFLQEETTRSQGLTVVAKTFEISSEQYTAAREAIDIYESALLNGTKSYSENPAAPNVCVDFVQEIFRAAMGSPEADFVNYFYNGEDGTPDELPGAVGFYADYRYNSANEINAQTAAADLQVTADYTLDEIASLPGNETFLANRFTDETGATRFLIREDSLVDVPGYGPVHFVVTDDGLGFYGGTGQSDFIIADGNANTLVGGSGDDVLTGGSGGDTFVFSGDDGTNVITDYNASQGDVIEFTDVGITPITLTSARIGNDLALFNAAGTTTVALQGLFASAAALPIVLRFADGTQSVFTFDETGQRVEEQAVEYIQTGTDGDDTIYTAHLGSAVFGGGGSDTILGTSGDDIIFAGPGDDGWGAQGVQGNTGNDTIYGGDGDDKIYGNAGDDRLFGEGGRDSLVGGTGSDYISGGPGNDSLSDGNDAVLIADSGNDVLLGGDGDDWLNSVFGNDYLDGSEGNDRIYLRHTSEAHVVGGAGNDFVYDYSSGDTIIDTGSENDRVELNSGGANSVNLGDGNDLVQARSAPGNDILYGGPGEDSIYYDYVHYPITIDLELGYASGDDIGFDLLSGFEKVVGGRGADTIIGDAQNNELLGAQGNDVIHDGAGSDYVMGGLDDDTIVAADDRDDDIYDGGLGAYQKGVNDTVDYSNVTAFMVIDLNTGIATGAGTDTLINIDNVYLGAVNGIILGNSMNNYFIGGVNNDTIDGGAGNDTLYAGAGDDMVYGGLGDDTIVGGTGQGNDLYDGGDGTDTLVFPSTSQGVEVDLEVGIATGMEIDTDTLSNIENVDGGSGDDIIRGDTNANTLRGMGGNDTLEGRAGNDTLVGGVGSDTYVFNLGDGQDVIIEDGVDTGSDTLLFGAGISAEDVTFSLNGDDLLVNLAGGERVSVQNWNTGSEAMVETFRFNDGTEITASQVNAMFAPPQLAGHGLVADLQAAMGEDAVLEGLVNQFDALLPTQMSEANGLMTDILLQWAGVADVAVNSRGPHVDGRKVAFLEKISGQEPGTSQLSQAQAAEADDQWNQFFREHFSSLATQTFLQAALPDAVYDVGADAIHTSLNLAQVMVNAELMAPLEVTQAAYFWSAVLSTLRPLAAEMGASVSQVIEAVALEVSALEIPEGTSYTPPADLSGSDVLFGSVNADSITGGTGDDIIFAGGGGDIVSGDQQGDFIIGGEGNDIILGGDGDDTILGGNGDDFIIGGGGRDEIFGEGGNDNLTGSQLHDLLDGGEGNDTLTGNEGDDILHGGTGTDQLIGGSGSDTYLFNRGDGADTITEDGRDFTGVDVGSDTLEFGDSIAPEDVTFAFSGSNLVISVDGTSDSVTIQNWSSSPYAVVETIRFSNGLEVAAAEVAAIVAGGGKVEIPNEAPVAESSAVSGAEDSGPIALGLTASDPEGDPLTITVTGMPASSAGVVTLADGVTAVANGQTLSQTDFEGLLFHPAADYNGATTFTYEVTDGEHTATGSAGITVTPVNDAPVLAAGGNTAAPVVVREVHHEFSSDTPDFPPLMERQRLDRIAEINGITRDNLTLEEAHEVSVNFVQEGAGYKNTLGVYTVDAAGNIQNVQIIAENLSGTGRGVFGGGSFNSGDLIANLGNLPAGTELGFFIIGNGYNTNKKFNTIDLQNGSLEFRIGGTGANIADTAPPDLVFTDADGHEKTLKGHIYHTITNFNPDGEEHVVSGLDENGNLQIGFEDLRNLGDADFNDVVIQLAFSTGQTREFEAVEVAPNLEISDVDSVFMAAASVEITAGAQAGDALALSGFTVGTGGTITGTNVQLVENSGGRLAFTGEDTAATYEALLRAVTFTNTAIPEEGDRAVTITLEDAEGTATTLGVNVAVDAFLDPTATESTLTLAAGETADLAATGLEALESVSMENGSSGNAVNLSFSDILDLSTEDTLTIRGDTGDAITLTGSASRGGDVEMGGTTFATFMDTASTASLLVELGLSLNGEDVTGLS